MRSTVILCAWALFFAEKWIGIVVISCIIRTQLFEYLLSCSEKLLFSSGVSVGRRVFLGRQQEPPRAPAVGREETRSLSILQAPFPATDKKEIHRLFSALPGNNRSQREVFLVQPQLRWRKLRHHAAPLPQRQYRHCLYF